MKQTAFMVQIVIKDDKPVIIISAPNGAIIHTSNSVEEVSSFLAETIETLSKPVNSSNN